MQKLETFTEENLEYSTKKVKILKLLPCHEQAHEHAHV